MRFEFRVIVLCIWSLLPAIALAQPDSSAHKSRIWVAPVVATGTALAFDGEVREWALQQHSARLDRLARVVNPFGTGARLMPAMAGTWVAAVVFQNRPLSRGTLETAAAYAANDLAESLLKPAFGRERPHVEGNSRRFRPFTANGDWHSLPSAHIAHITSIVAAIEAQTSSLPLNVAGGALVALMSWDRVYEDQHWSSDAAFTIALSSFISRRTVRWIESRWPKQ